MENLISSICMTKMNLWIQMTDYLPYYSPDSRKLQTNQVSGYDIHTTPYKPVSIV